jgi:CxxC motif-containing protein (DUF1111 family)
VGVRLQGRKLCGTGTNAVSQQQPGRDPLIQGEFFQVAILEAPGQTRIGRFGWKNQFASLLSFSGGAYLAEMGITNRLSLIESTSSGRFVDFAHGYLQFDEVPDPAPNGEDLVNDIDKFAAFMRATKAPPRDPVRINNIDVKVGDKLFEKVGCDICHVRTFTTLPAGTVINGGTFTIPPALGSKTIHPFGDFLLHDVGTGDGIRENGPATSRNKLRTPPLWGVRTRARLMHDGSAPNNGNPANDQQQSMTFNEAILRHAGEATNVINTYRLLSIDEKQALIAFLKSL